MGHLVTVNPGQQLGLPHAGQRVPHASSSAASTRVSCTTAFLLCPFAATVLT